MIFCRLIAALCLLVLLLASSFAEAITKGITQAGWGATKPPVGVQINWGHPLARGLGGIVLLNEGGGSIFELLSGGGFTLQSGTDFAPSIAGLGLRMNGTNEGAYWLVPDRLKPATKVTIFWRGVRLGTPDNFSNFSCVFYNAAQSDPFVSYGFFVAGGAVDVNAAWNNGALQTLGLGVMPAIGTIGSLALTIDGTTARGYKNGVEVANTTAGVGTISYTSTSQWGIGEQTALARNPNHITDVSYIWPGIALGADLIYWLHASPYAFLLQPMISRMLWDLDSAGAVSRIRMRMGIGP